jgi:hypothetical protein
VNSTATKNLKSVKVLVANAEAVMISILSNSNSNELRDIYRSIVSIHSKIDNIDKAEKE